MDVKKELNDNELLEEQYRLEKELDKTIEKKVKTLSEIRDILNNISNLEEKIASIKDNENSVEEDILKIKGEIKRITKEIREIHEGVVKKEGERDIKGLEEIENKRIEMHEHKTELLRQLAEKEAELDEITIKKTKILDEITEMIKKRSKLEGILDNIDKKEMKLKERKLEIESMVDKQIADITNEIDSIDEGLPVGEEIKEEIPEKGPVPIHKKTMEEKIEKTKEKPHRKGILGIFGKAREKEIDEFGNKVIQLKRILPIIDDLITKLPNESIERFSSSEDYRLYGELYDITKEYSGTKEQKEFIKKNTKKVLEAIDKLLEELPDDVIDAFSSSNEFDEYTKLLDMFGV